LRKLSPGARKKAKAGPAPRPGILGIAPYVGGDSELPGIAKPIKLASNESALGPSPKAVAAYRDCAASLHRYPDGSHKALREAIARRYALKAENIVCGNGSDELLALLAKGYCGPGDEVLYTEHGFLIYPIVALAAGATPVVAPESGLRTDVDALLKRVTKRTRIVFLANPNNPTGSYIPRRELKRLRDGLPDHVLLVLDAAYAEFVTVRDYSAGADLVATHDNVVMTRTFSKIYALSALRLGWALCPPNVAAVLNRLRGPFNLNTPAQAAGIAALEDAALEAQAREHNTRWRDWLAVELSRFGLQVYPSVTNFLLVRFGAGAKTGAAAADKFLRREGIILRRVDNYGLPECLRITIGREDEMKKLVSAIGRFLGRS
jgi:histidinol-phosphate aminotransferase